MEGDLSTDFADGRGFERSGERKSKRFFDRINRINRMRKEGRVHATTQRARRKRRGRDLSTKEHERTRKKSEEKRVSRRRRGAEEEMGRGLWTGWGRGLKCGGFG
jgi:predicted methyltransferase